MKQTAIEWLVNQMSKSHTSREWDKIIEQAKQIEKEQIMDASESMYIKCKGGDGMPVLALKDLVENQYNKIYK